MKKLFKDNPDLADEIEKKIRKINPKFIIDILIMKKLILYSGCLLILLTSCYRDPSKNKEIELSNWEKKLKYIDSLLAKNPKNDSLWAERALIFLSVDQIDSAYFLLAKHY